MSLSRDIATSYMTLIDEGEEPDRVATATVNFLKENNLQNLVDKVLEHVSSLEQTKRDYNSANITFADKSGEDYAKDIAKNISSDDVEINTNVDESLIGGFVARYRGKEWDASINGVLERLRANLKTN